MISDEERREVAAKLREIREDEHGEVYMYDVMLALGIESGKAAYWADEEFIHHLADLIDRPTAKGIIEDDGTSVCGHCGFRFDVSVEVAGCFSEVVLANHCPQCGRLLVWREEVDE